MQQARAGRKGHFMRTKTMTRILGFSQTTNCWSIIEHYPRGCVVARVFLTANPSVYSREHQSITHCWREQEMIQPHPLV